MHAAQISALESELKGSQGQVAELKDVLEQYHKTSEVAIKSLQAQLRSAKLANDSLREDLQRLRLQLSDRGSNAAGGGQVGIEAWIRDLDGGKGSMMQYLEPVQREFGDQGWIQQLTAAVSLAGPGGNSLLDSIDPIVFDILGVQRMGHKLLLARGMVALYNQLPAVSKDTNSKRSRERSVSAKRSKDRSTSTERPSSLPPRHENHAQIQDRARSRSHPTSRVQSHDRSRSRSRDQSQSKENHGGRSRSHSRYRCSASRSLVRRPRLLGASGGKSENNRWCFLHIVGTCRKGDKCDDRHPEGDELVRIKDTMGNKMCHRGKECTRETCIFKHPEGRKVFTDTSRRRSLSRQGPKDRSRFRSRDRSISLKREEERSRSKFRQRSSSVKRPKERSRSKSRSKSLQVSFRKPRERSVSLKRPRERSRSKFRERSSSLRRPKERSRSGSSLKRQRQRSRSRFRERSPSVKRPRQRSRSISKSKSLQLSVRMPQTLPPMGACAEDRTINMAVVLGKPSLLKSDETIWQAEIDVPGEGLNHAGTPQICTIRGPLRKTRERAEDDAKRFDEAALVGPQVAMTLAGLLRSG